LMAKKILAMRIRPCPFHFSGDIIGCRCLER
jgi:hypothetical protein